MSLHRDSGTLPAESRVGLVCDEWARFHTLNLGCGQLLKPDALNVDHWPGLTGLQACLDLNRTPWPFFTDWYDEIWCLDILEHLNDMLAAMQELYRVARVGALIHVRGPAWDREQSFTDPTHKRFFTPETFTFYEPGHWRHLKYPSYHRGCAFHTHSAKRDGEEFIFELERL